MNPPTMISDAPPEADRPRRSSIAPVERRACTKAGDAGAGLAGRLGHRAGSSSAARADPFERLRRRPIAVTGSAHDQPTPSSPPAASPRHQLTDIDTDGAAGRIEAFACRGSRPQGVASWPAPCSHHRGGTPSDRPGATDGGQLAIDATGHLVAASNRNRGLKPLEGTGRGAAAADAAAGRPRRAERAGPMTPALLSRVGGLRFVSADVELLLGDDVAGPRAPTGTMKLRPSKRCSPRSTSMRASHRRAGPSAPTGETRATRAIDSAVGPRPHHRCHQRHRRCLTTSNLIGTIDGCGLPWTASPFRDGCREIVGNGRQRNGRIRRTIWRSSRSSASVAVASTPSTG